MDIHHPANRIKATKALQLAQFTPLQEKVTCSNLYCVKDLLTAVRQGISELIAGLETTEGEKIYKQDQTHSNTELLLSSICVIAGTFCFFLPFNEVSHALIFALAMVYGLVMSLLTLMDAFITREVVMVVDGNAAGVCGKLVVMAHVDVERKRLRLAVSEYSSMRKSIEGAIQRGRLELSRLTWRKAQKLVIKMIAPWIEMQYRLTKGERLEKEKDEDDDRWEWIPTPGALDNDHMNYMSEYVRSGGAGMLKKDQAGKGKGLILERRINRYFDTEGCLQARTMSDDLRALLVRYYSGEEAK